MTRKKKPLMKSTKQIPKRNKTQTWRLLAVIVILSSLIFVLIGWSNLKYRSSQSLGIPTLLSAQASTTPKLYDFEIVRSYEHDGNAFTQGLQFDLECAGKGTQCNEVFWESTGLYGKSTVRKVHASSGKVLGQTYMPSRYFGEGLTRLGNLLYQLTWLTPKVFVYDLDLKKVEERKHPLKDGWGLTTDGKDLIMTDSGSLLYWINPETFNITKQIQVKFEGRHIKSLNELEWIEGLIWANVWQKDCIAQISPEDGRVVGWILLEELTRQTILAHRQSSNRRQPIDVLNGIAYDQRKRRLFVTGKLWPTIYEIKLKEVGDLSEERWKHVREVCVP